MAKPALIQGKETIQNDLLALRVTNSPSSETVDAIRNEGGGGEVQLWIEPNSSTDFAQPSMPPKPKGKKQNKPRLSEHHKKKNVIKVSLQDVAICWCRGFRIGCGKALGRTQCFEHKRAEKERERDC
jgi:hypothetical protein